MAARRTSTWRSSSTGAPTSASSRAEVTGAHPPLPGTLAFFVRTRAIYPGGPGLFAAYAMDSYATAAWTWLLRHRLRELTTREGFFMATLEGPRERVTRGRYSDFAGEWKAQLVLDHSFEAEAA